MVLLLAWDAAHVSVDKVACGRSCHRRQTSPVLFVNVFETTSASGVLPNISLHIPHLYRHLAFQHHSSRCQYTLSRSRCYHRICTLRTSGTRVSLFPTRISLQRVICEVSHSERLASSPTCTGPSTDGIIEDNNYVANWLAQSARRCGCLISSPDLALETSPTSSSGEFVCPSPGDFV